MAVVWNATYFTAFGKDFRQMETAEFLGWTYCITYCAATKEWAVFDIAGALYAGPFSNTNLIKLEREDTATHMVLVARTWNNLGIERPMRYVIAKAQACN